MSCYLFTPDMEGRYEEPPPLHLYSSSLFFLPISPNVLVETDTRCIVSSIPYDLHRFS